MGWFEDFATWTGIPQAIDQTSDYYLGGGIEKDIQGLYDDITGATPYKLQAQAALEASKTEADAATKAAEIAATAATQAADVAAKAAKEAADTQSAAAIQAANTSAAAAQEAARIYAEASNFAANKQIEYGQLAVAEQQRQFGAMQGLMSPYVQTGTDALSRQRDLLGLEGTEAQRASIEGISQSPEMLAMIGQGENALLQQGAATGGLRGGNTAAALAQFRPSILSSLINQQYERLGGLSQSGQSAAGMVGQAGLQTGANVANLLTRQGEYAGQGILGAGGATAEGAMGAGQATSQGQLLSGQYSGAGLLGSGQARAQGILGAGQATAQGLYNAGQANAAGQYGYAQGMAGAQNMRWQPVREGINLAAQLGAMYLGGPAAAAGVGAATRGGQTQFTQGSAF